MRSKTRSPFHRPANGLKIEASGDEASIYIYAEIGFWGINARDFTAALNEVNARTIHLHINSPGGDVFEGLAIANAIRAHSARVVTHIDALAASIASIIAIAGDRVVMAENAFMMIHNPWCLAMGSAPDLRKQADLLDKIGGSLVGEYVKRSGATEAEIQAWLDAETWFSADEALDAGFIDKIEHETKDPEESVAARFDLSVFKHAPAALLRDEDERTTDPTVRELESALRDAGLSRSRAKQLVAAGLKAVTPSRDASATDEQLEAQLKELVATMSKQ